MISPSTILPAKAAPPDANIALDPGLWHVSRWALPPQGAAGLQSGRWQMPGWRNAVIFPVSPQPRAASSKFPPPRVYSHSLAAVVANHRHDRHTDALNPHHDLSELLVAFQITMCVNYLVEGKLLGIEDRFERA